MFFFNFIERYQVTLPHKVYFLIFLESGLEVIQITIFIASDLLYKLNKGEECWWSFLAEHSTKLIIEGRLVKFIKKYM